MIRVRVRRTTSAVLFPCNTCAQRSPRGSHVRQRDRLGRAQHIAEHAEVQHPAQRCEAGGEADGIRRLDVDARESGRACVRRPHLPRERRRDGRARAAIYSRRSTARFPAARATVLSLPRRGAAVSSSFEAFERQTARDRAAAAARRPESPACRSAESRAWATRPGSGGPTRVPSGGPRAEALGQMTEARHASGKRELLAADAVRQRLEQRRETLGTQSGAAASQLGKAGLAPHAAPERREVEVEREEPS